MRVFLDWESRAVAHLRARWRLLVVTAVASLAVTWLFAVAPVAEDRKRAIFEVLTFGSVLLPMIVGHGMIAGDLRSGVALLWLQKPVNPVPFFMRRALDVTLLGVTLVLALWGAGASITALSAGLENGREVLAALPGTLLLVLCLFAMLFAFSAFGVPTDTMFVVAFFFASTFSLLAGGRVTEALMWVALPVEAITTLTRFLAGGGGSGALEALLLYARFLALWVTAGAIGLALSTRSPLPKEVSR